MAKEKEKDLKSKKKKDSPPEPSKDAKTNSKQNEAGTEETQTANDMEEQLATEKDRVLRLSAEFENYKKRKQREIDDFKKFANESVFRQLLTVVDNLERAIVSAEKSDDENSLLEGVKLTHKDILKMFEAFSLKPVEAQDQPFDPNFHQAVTQEGNNNLPENTVTQVLQKGYILHDRLIRPAMVVVSKKAQKEMTETKEEE